MEWIDEFGAAVANVRVTKGEDARVVVMAPQERRYMSMTKDWGA